MFSAASALEIPYKAPALGMPQPRAPWAALGRGLSAQEVWLLCQL